jgi:chromosome segregation ATPase
VTAGGLSIGSSDNAQIVLIPGSTQTQIQTTTQITSNAQVTTAGSGVGCNAALNDLNTANVALSTNTNNFVAINNELNNANNTLINLRLNQTTVTTQLQQYTLQANVSNNNVSQINTTLTSVQNNLTSLQGQLTSLNNKIRQDQARLQQLNA